MAVPKGSNKIETIIHDWSDDDRQDAIDFATHPSNGATAVATYLNHRGLKASLDTVHRWQKSLIAESERINRIRQVMGEFRGLETIEILSFIAAVMADTLVTIQEKIASSGQIDLKDIQALTSVAKEARSAAVSLMASQSSQSIVTSKDAELGFVMAAFDKLETVFEKDEAVLDRIKLACKGILLEVESQYQS